MVVCDAQGGFGNKDVDGGVVNWKLLPAGVGNHCVGFAARRAGAYILSSVAERGEIMHTGPIAGFSSSR
jgi:hypothetical protein